MLERELYVSQYRVREHGGQKRNKRPERHS